MTEFPIFTDVMLMSHIIAFLIDIHQRKTCLVKVQYTANYFSFIITTFALQHLHLEKVLVLI